MKTILTAARMNTEQFAAGGRSPANSGLLNSAQPNDDRWGKRSPAIASKTILVPLALTGDSRAVLQTAKCVARNSEAKLVLLHAVQLNIAGEEYGIPRARLFTELCQNAEIQLQQVANCIGGDVATEILVCEGQPAKAIIETANRLRADTIIMHTHGYRGWRSWLHRNTVRAIMRQAPCGICLVLRESWDGAPPLMILAQTATNSLSGHLGFDGARSLFR
jgi:nucleotide-binding universal stress UspA family protein